MADQLATESTQTELLTRMKALRTPTEPEGQPEESEAVDASIEAPESDDTLQAEEVEQQETAEQTDDESISSEELTETLEGEEGAEESPDDVVYSIGDKEITLKQLDDLEKGGMKEVDYRQKTQKLADERRSFEAKRTETLDTLQSHIDIATQMLDSEFEGVDWDELRDLDTGEYLKLKEKKEGRQDKLKQATAKRQELVSADLLERQTKGNQELVSLNPNWVDSAGKPTKAYEEDNQHLANFAKANSLTQDDINAVLTNGRIMQALINSDKFTANIAKAPALTKKVKKAPVVVKGKRASVTNIQSQINEAQAKFKQSGKVEDAMTLRKLKRQL